MIGVARFARYQNKIYMHEYFRKKGVICPNTHVFHSLSEARAAESEVTYPSVIKIPDGFSSGGIRQATDVAEFRSAMEESAFPVIVQAKVTPVALGSVHVVKWCNALALELSSCLSCSDFY